MTIERDIGNHVTDIEKGSTTMHLYYDQAGRPLMISYAGTNYYYKLNLQGDVIGIINTSGTEVVSYTYDAWGKQLTCTGSLASTLGANNPLRYRGYIYDTETGLYYLQARYYNPNWRGAGAAGGPAVLRTAGQAERGARVLRGTPGGGRSGRATGMKVRQRGYGAGPDRRDQYAERVCVLSE